MPLIRVNSGDAGLRLHGSPADPMVSLRRQARDGEGPVIVMVHGFKFLPEHPTHCPHLHILSMEDVACWKAASWPRGLGFGQGAPDEGLGVAFGWDARGTIWNAYARAARAGRDLARLVATVRAVAPHRPVHALAHSLGARVVLQALPHLRAGDLDRIITLNAAEFAGAAEAALSQGAGAAAELIAVTGRENAAFDTLLERLVAPEHRRDRALARGLGPAPRRFCLRLDRAEVVERLAELGHPLAPERRLVCHWSPYLRDGTLALYAALMRRPETLPLAALRLPEPAPRPRRCMPQGWSLPLPPGSKASS